MAAHTGKELAYLLGCIGEVLILRTYESEFAGSMANKVYDYERWEDMGTLIRGIHEIEWQKQKKKNTWSRESCLWRKEKKR